MLQPGLLFLFRGCTSLLGVLLQSLLSILTILKRQGTNPRAPGPWWRSHSGQCFCAELGDQQSGELQLFPSTARVRLNELKEKSVFLEKRINILVCLRERCLPSAYTASLLEVYPQESSLTQLKWALASEGLIAGCSRNVETQRPMAWSSKKLHFHFLI